MGKPIGTASGRQARVTEIEAQTDDTPLPEWGERRSGALATLGGRFISRGRLSASAVYWLAWLTVSPRAGATAGVEREIDALGLGAVKLVGSAAVLVGLIATFLVASQLVQYSAGAIGPKTIGWFTAREFGPLVVALLIVARSAPAIAGELASMNANGEIDALRAMGLNPVKYLVAPKLAALLIVVPALTIIADGLILVGAWVGHTVFLGFSPSYFFEQFRSGFDLRDVFIGLGKSIIFAFVLGIIAADEGLKAERRMSAIGSAATRAVVFCLIGVLGADTLVNAIFYFIPGLV